MTVPFPQLRRRLVAILRGVKTGEIIEVGTAVFEAGIEAIEVPLNSPDPFRSIEMLAKILPKNALIGAGTVLTAAQVDDLYNAGGRLLVSPNIDRAVMERAAHHGMVTMPGVFTPTEALLALSLGASALKFFPANALGPQGISAIKAILPNDAVIGAVGGVSEKNFADYARIGISTFGLGSSLYAPGLKPDAVARRASAAVSEWDSVFASG
ncbi:MAG: 2-dehydro-3-deoxy-6-phosphogalactonate aldolase [Rhizobiaceae bacterium]|nr:2-dehydro-3-deoxy-6-phosphogalactonate aldolase [Rhizobiaceae bacterium]